MLCNSFYMIRFSKNIFLLVLVFVQVLSGAFQNAYGQLTPLPDSLKLLLTYFQKNTDDPILKKAITELQTFNMNDYSNDSLSGKLLKVEELLVSSSLNEQNIFSYTHIVTNLLWHLLPQGEHPDYAYSVEYIAQWFYRKAEYQKALMLYSEALGIKKKSLGELHPLYTTSLSRLAGIYYVLEQYDKALPLREEELLLTKKISGENNINYANSLINLIWTLHRMGQYDKALPFCQQTLTILQNASVEKDTGYANILSNLARLYHRMGQYDKALLLYERTVIAMKKIFGELHLEYAVSLGNHAYFLDKIMGQYDRAQPLYEQALLILKNTSGENHFIHITTLNNLAYLYYTMGKYDRALRLYEQVLEITKQIKGEVHPWYANSLCNLANIYYKIGQNDKALRISHEALTILNNTSIEKHPGYSISLGNLAALYHDMGKYNTALPLMQKFSTITKRISGEDHPLFAVSLNNLGMLHSVIGNDTEAGHFLIKASGITLNHLSQSYSTLSEQEKLAILKQESTQFDFLPSLLSTAGGKFPVLANHLYTNQLALKGMVLEDQQNVLRSIRKTGDSSTLQLFDQWRINKLYLGKQLLSPLASRVPYFDSLQYITTLLEQKLSQRTSLFRNQLQSQRITPTDIGNKLLQGEAAIEFIRFSLYNKKWTDSILYAAMILLPQDSMVRYIPLCEEKQLLHLLGHSTDYAIDDVVIEKLYGDERGGGPLSDSLFQLIWKPLEKYFVGIHTIYYAPAGLLHRIAFQALLLDSTHFLIDKYRLNQVLSTRSVALPVQVNSKPLSIGVWGNIKYNSDKSMISRQLTKNKNNFDLTNSSFDFYNSDTRGSRGDGWDPLPSSKREMDSLIKICQHAGIRISTLSDSLATEEAFKKLDGKSPQVLHLATHGFFLPISAMSTNTNVGDVYKVQQNPMFRSGLVLAGGNHAWKGEPTLPDREDGILTAYEIAHIDLSHTQLVVLSACETALGDLQGTEGVLGLQRAFKMAGVKQIIVSLWSVYDEPTMELMTMFYRNWLSGQSTREALRNAQLNIKVKYREPYYWAPFVVVE